MRLANALDDIFAGRSEVRVLRALEELPEGLAVSARELARRSGLSHPTVSNVLAGLTDQGVVQARRAPRGDAFELNRRHALSERLRSLFDWERQLLREFVIFVAGQIRRRAPRVSAAYLFGSAVRGEMTADKVQGLWADAGENIDFYLKACNMIAQNGANKEISNREIK